MDSSLSLFLFSSQCMSKLQILVGEPKPMGGSEKMHLAGKEK